MAQRAIESAREQALGPCGLSKSAGSDSTERLTHVYAAGRRRALSGDDLASLGLDAVYEP